MTRGHFLYCTCLKSIKFDMCLHHLTIIKVMNMFITPKVSSCPFVILLTPHLHPQRTTGLLFVTIS